MLPIMPDPNTPQGLEPLSPEYLAWIAARAEAATAGPWCTDGAEIYQGDEYVSYAFWVGETCRADEADGGTVDAAFIAHARTDVPALLAEIERLRAELAKVREAAAAARYYLGAFVHDSEDPGTGPLGALHMLGAAGIPAERGDLSEQVMARHVAAAVEDALAARPTRAEVLRETAPEMDAIAHEYGVFGVGSRLRQLADAAEAEAPRTERSRWQAVADALNAIDVLGIDLDGTLTDHNAWSVVWDRGAERWAVSGYDAEAGEPR
ncbi:hypothetical protein CLM85_06330 [Streptomyces albidoflavus]|uniref:hypothetical protein n=1 Tax=Streptomyces albidoflavus TaxID=1886 RepID=UPI000BADD876|nr:hypothetical protein [Streptomyces albidoflavus]PAX88893.1 hypothetical protein CLM82_23185 [Streptomyces albidoflavus]PBO17360.1 hypothetical protein CLM83_18555 [Streptomyces albidoflavus]PBO25094.1 hypothetical protein CLM85_06330 [Streptomyces albidoflavus]PBO29784.1 hypothetical protein CLM84_12445 [Streptomyces albidoflavus]